MNDIPDADHEYPEREDYSDRDEYLDLDENPAPSAPLSMPDDGGHALNRRSAWSADAEQSVLGAILLDNDVMDQVMDVLVADDFYMGAHRVIFRAMQKVMERGDPADPIILNEYLQKNDELDSVGGGGYLAELLDTVPTTANAKFYARQVRNKAILRELARQAADISEAVFEGERSVDEILEQAEKQIF